MGDNTETNQDEDIDYVDETRPLINNEDKTEDPSQYEISFKRGKKARVGLLEIVVVSFYASLMSFFPIIQQYLYNRILNEELSKPLVNSTWDDPTVDIAESCGGNVSSTAETIAQERSAEWLLYFGLATNIPGIFSTLVLGAYTDFRGRKVGMIVPAIGGLIRTVISMFVIGLDWPIAFFVVGGFIDGCLGSFGTVFMASFAYLADVTEPGKQRSMRIAILQAAIGICMSASLMGTGFLIQGTGYFYPTLLGLGLLLLNLVLTICCLPETIKSRPDVKILDRARIMKTFTTYIQPREGGNRWKLLTLLVALFMVDMVQIGKAQMDTLFQLGVPFCWNAIKIGLYGAIGSFLQIFSMLLLLRPLQRCLSDTVIGMVGSFSGIAQLILTGAAVSDTMLYLAPFVGFLYAVPSAVIKSVMSELVGRQEQGCLFAGICSIQMFCSAVGSVLFNAVYISTVATFAGLVFFLMAGLYIICLVLLGFVSWLGRGIRMYQRIDSSS